MNGGCHCEVEHFNNGAFGDCLVLPQPWRLLLKSMLLTVGFFSSGIMNSASQFENACYRPLLKNTLYLTDIPILPLVKYSICADSKHIIWLQLMILIIINY